MPDNFETFQPCETCMKNPSVVTALNRHDRALVLDICPDCRKRWQNIGYRNTIREGLGPGALTEARVSVNFDIKGLAERVASMFVIREEELKSKVEAALETVFSDESISKIIEEKVRDITRARVEQEVRHTIQKAIDKKLGSREVREKIESYVRLETDRFLASGG